jgi:RNA polymerase sigma-70 factor (ECF subfamily)
MKTLSMDDFDNLYRQYGPMVLRRCRFILKNEEKALDAM